MRKSMGIFGVCMLHSLLSGLLTAVVVMIEHQGSRPQANLSPNWFVMSLPGVGLSIGTIVTLLLTPISGAMDSTLRNRNLERDCFEDRNNVERFPQELSINGRPPTFEKGEGQQ